MVSFFSVLHAGGVSCLEIKRLFLSGSVGIWLPDQVGSFLPGLEL